MAEKKLGFGVKKQRLEAIWTALGQDKTYKEVAAAYKKEYPAKDEQPSDQTIGAARKSAFNLPKKTRKTQEGPSVEQTITLMALLMENKTTAPELLEKLKETPVNPFQVYDDVVGGRESLVDLLQQIATAKQARDLIS